MDVGIVHVAVPPAHERDTRVRLGQNIHGQDSPAQLLPDLPSLLPRRDRRGV